MDTIALAQQVVFYGVIVLLVGVTGGIAYLTWAEWRDRRRRDRVKRKP